MTFEELEADARTDRYYEWAADQAKCRRCGAIVMDDGVGIYDEDIDEYFCNQKCVDNYENDRAEAAYLAQFEGEGPVTAGEQREQMVRWQRELK